MYELQTLFDFGETNAVALASALGIAALVTDDTKEQGPHDTLVKEYVEDIIPFSFYELLYLDYLQSGDYDNFKNDYGKINKATYPKYPRDFLSQIKRVVRKILKINVGKQSRKCNKVCKKLFNSLSLSLKGSFIHLQGGS